MYAHALRHAGLEPGHIYQTNPSWPWGRYKHWTGILD